MDRKYVPRRAQLTVCGPSTAVSKDLWRKIKFYSIRILFTSVSRTMKIKLHCTYGLPVRWRLDWFINDYSRYSLTYKLRATIRHIASSIHLHLVAVCKTLHFFAFLMRGLLSARALRALRRPHKRSSMRNRRPLSDHHVNDFVTITQLYILNMWQM